MPRILSSHLAKADLDRIWDHLADTASPAIADFMMARLFEGMQRAASNPTFYRQRTEFTGAPHQCLRVRHLFRGTARGRWHFRLARDPRPAQGQPAASPPGVAAGVEEGFSRLATFAVSEVSEDSVSSGRSLILRT